MKAVQTRLSIGDYNDLRKKAKALGYTVAAYVRKIILDSIKNTK